MTGAGERRSAKTGTEHFSITQAKWIGSAGPDHNNAVKAPNPNGARPSISVAKLKRGSKTCATCGYEGREGESPLRSNGPRQ